MRAGVTAVETAEAGPAPLAFVAVTVKVTALPLIKPVITQLSAGTATVQVLPVEDFAV
jgi:hypothetical protein